jgi:hypothetical protein
MSGPHTPNLKIPEPRAQSPELIKDTFFLAPQLTPFSPHLPCKLDPHSYTVGARCPACPLPRQSVGESKFIQNRLRSRFPLLKISALRGKLTSGEPLLDSGEEGEQHAAHPPALPPRTRPQPAPSLEGLQFLAAGASIERRT